jgi:hypothetical protein
MNLSFFLCCRYIILSFFLNRCIILSFQKKVDSLDSLRFVMSLLKEVRERESCIEAEIVPILDMYSMLENYLPPGCMDKEEMDLRSVLRSSWRKVQNISYPYSYPYPYPYPYP